MKKILLVLSVIFITSLKGYSQTPTDYIGYLSYNNSNNEIINSNNGTVIGSFIIDNQFINIDITYSMIAIAILTCLLLIVFSRLLKKDSLLRFWKNRILIKTEIQ